MGRSMRYALQKKAIERRDIDILFQSCVCAEGRCPFQCGVNVCAIRTKSKLPKYGVRNVNDRLTSYATVLCVSVTTKKSHRAPRQACLTRIAGVGDGCSRVSFKAAAIVSAGDERDCVDVLVPRRKGSSSKTCQIVLRRWRIQQA